MEEKLAWIESLGVYRRPGELPINQVTVTPRKRTPFRRRLACQVGRIARKQALVAILLAVLTLGARAVLLRSVPIPKPAIQDEFSYLLAGDTYASGRLTNPKHPLWIHFETVHLLVQPTYQSKYPPAQGLVLALGQIVLGDPWFGVWLSMGAMIAAIYWALAGWLPPKWALLGGVFALLRVGFLNYWSESYWGGSVAAAAGALVIGAVPRLRRKPDPKTAVVLAVGLAVLANSRPFEGAILGLVCLGAVLVKVPIRWLVRPLAFTLIPVALWMMYYDYRVTGHPFRMPYMEHERQYETSSPFAWQSGVRPEPHYNHDVLRATYVGWDQTVRIDEHARPVQVRWGRLLMLDKFFLGAPLTLCIGAFLVRIWRRQPKMRFAILLFLLFFVGIEMETSLTPHYAAPGTAFVFVIAAAALRRLWHYSPPLMQAALALIVVLSVRDLARPQNRWLYDKQAFIARRDSVLHRLTQQPGKQLVLVDYGKGHDVNQEWVYNRADIDHANIVWAREMGTERDQELIEYYPDRQVWKLVDHGDAGVDLAPLPSAERAQR